MKRIIRLTEGDLTRLIRRVIKEEKNMLSESATINGVKVDVNGGNLSATVKGVVKNYSITVRCGKEAFGIFVPVYTGPIALTSLWNTKDNGIAGKDNTGKLFTIPATKATNLVSQMSSGAQSIKTEGEGTIMGVTGSCSVTLKKK